MSKHKYIHTVYFNTCIKYDLYKPAMKRYQYRLIKLRSRPRIIWLNSRSKSRLRSIQKNNIDENTNKVVINPSDNKPK